MSGWRLVLRAQPRLRVDARALQPSSLSGLTPAEVERVSLRQGRDAVLLAELFDIDRFDGSSTAQLVIEGDLSRFDHVGWGMSEGELRVRGSVGDYAGAALAGGHITIEGNAADLAACAMRGGWLEVHGDVGDLAGAALPGEMDGMRGGTLVVRGNAAARLADRMRRGTVVVFGNVGDLMASRMVAGTIALAGRCGIHPGWGMRRGSIVFAGPAPVVAPTFVPLHSNADVFWQLLARDLAQFGGPFATLAQRRLRRHAGDVAMLGKGELLIPD
ncbi:MAG TPA: formylmethanofuran dehydrogenase subunit C [Burkholderiaceae bacterium]|nr:formylmethanofuran dehydrogenase subunit C [Burkholderiaceae bacterium]